MTTVRAHVPERLVSELHAAHGRLTEMLGETAARLTLEVASGHGDDCWWTVDGRPAMIGAQGATLSLDAQLEHVLRRPGLFLGGDCGQRSPGTYLADIGCRPGSLARTETRGASMLCEFAEQALTDATIIIEAPTAILEQTRNSDAELVPQLRGRVSSQHGVTLPRMQLTLHDDWSEGARVRMNDVVVPLPLAGADPSSWRDVVSSLDMVISRRLHWLLRVSDVADAVEGISYLMPALARATQETYPITTLTAVLREHLRRGGRLRNLARLLWLLLDLGPASTRPDGVNLTESPLGPTPPLSPAQQDPVILASLLRKSLIEDRWRAGLLPTPSATGRLSAVTEESIVGATPSTIAAAEWAALEEVVQLGRPPLMVTRTAAAVDPLIECVRALENPPAVLAADELPPDVDLRLTAVAVEPSTSRWASG